MVLAGMILRPAVASAATAIRVDTQSPKKGISTLLQPTVAQSSVHRVIVTLKGLEAGPEWADRIAQARARVMGALKDHRVVVNRVYDLVPALALTVDDDALRVLRSHPDVASIADDGTSTPGSGAGSKSD